MSQFALQAEQLLVGTSFLAMFAWSAACFLNSKHLRSKWPLWLMYSLPLVLLVIGILAVWMFRGVVPLRWAVLIPWFLVALLSNYFDRFFVWFGGMLAKPRPSPSFIYKRH